MVGPLRGEIIHLNAFRIRKTFAQGVRETLSQGISAEINVPDEKPGFLNKGQIGRPRSNIHDKRFRITGRIRQLECVVIENRRGIDGNGLKTKFRNLVAEPPADG